MYKLGLIGLLAYAFTFMGIEEFGLITLPISILGAYICYRKDKRVEVINMKLFLVYFIFLVVGVVFNIFSKSGLKGAETFAIINLNFGVILIFINIVRKPKEIFLLRDIFICSGVVVGAISIYQYIQVYIKNGYSEDAVMFYRSTGIDGIFYSGVLLTVTGIMLIAKLYLEKMEWTDKKDRIKNIFWIISAVVIFQGLLMTKLRAGIYAFIFVYFLILIYRFNWKKALIFIAALSIIYGITPEHVKKYSEAVTIKSDQENPRKNSDNLRRIMWNGAYNIWKQSPVIGVGNSTRVVRDKMNEYMESIEDEEGYISYGIKGKDFKDRLVDSHSMYLNVLMQNGFLILLFIFFLVYIVPEQFYKNYMGIEKLKDTTSETQLEKYRSINGGAMGGIISLMIIGLAWDVWHWSTSTQEIFQFMLMFLLLVSGVLSKKIGGENV